MNSSSNSTAVVNYQRRRKADLISVMGGKCIICGFDSFQEALDFHHVNPNEKEFNINIIKNLSDQLNELRKCILVCSNCHRGLHGGHLEIPQKWQENFDEEKAQLLLKKLEEVKHGKRHYCQECGREITKKATYCEECASFKNRKVERPSREILKKMIWEKPFTQVAQIFNVSDNAIRKWCVAYNLPKKRSDIKKYTEEEWLNI